MREGLGRMRSLLLLLAALALLTGVAGQDDYEYEDDADYEDEGEYDEDGDYKDDYDEDAEYEDYEDEDCGEDGYCTEDSDEYQTYSDAGPGSAELPIFRSVDETEVTVDLGNTARLTCTVDHLGQNMISWVKGTEIITVGDQLIDKERAGTILETSPSSSSSSTTSSSSTLSLTLVTQKDMGVYTCQVNMIGGASISKEYIIETRAPALVSILKKPESGEVTLRAGQPLSLSCEGRGDPVPTMKWHKMHSLLPVAPHSDGGELNIPSVTDSHSGTYVCEATNGFGQPAQDSIKIAVKHKPILALTETYRRHPQTREIEALLFTCIVRAHPAASAKWSRGDASLEPGRTSLLEEEGRLVLEIDRPTKADLGIYTCEASNSEGTIFEVLNSKETDLLPEAVAVKAEVEEEREEEEEMEEREEMEEMEEAAVFLPHSAASSPLFSSVLLILLICTALNH